MEVIDTFAVWANGSTEGPAIGASREPNAFGLYDMSGNLYEWVNDINGPYSEEPQVDPLNLEGTNSRVRRGGSFKSEPLYLSSGRRGYGSGFTYTETTGFRVVRKVFE